MTIFLHSHLGDGLSLIVDTSDKAQFLIPTDEWPRIAGLPNEEQRTRLEQIKAEHQADPTGGRTQADEEAMETAANASTGEAHEQSERGAVGGAGC